MKVTTVHPQASKKYSKLHVLSLNHQNINFFNHWRFWCLNIHFRLQIPLKTVGGKKAKRALISSTSYHIKRLLLKWEGENRKKGGGGFLFFQPSSVFRLKKSCRVQFLYQPFSDIKGAVQWIHRTNLCPYSCKELVILSLLLFFVSFYCTCSNNY